MIGKLLLFSAGVGIGYAVWRILRAADKADALERQPLQEPTHPDPKQRITWSTLDKDQTVRESAEVLLAQARRYDPKITLDELAGARLAASEYASGSFTELAAIVDSELNRAKRQGKSLFESLTHSGTFSGTFGRQAANKRPASTRRDPRLRHLMAARAVLSGRARGVSRGAVRFFDPKEMDRLHNTYVRWLKSDPKGKKPLVVSCDALSLLEAWSFDLGRNPTTSNRCPPNRAKRGKGTLAWVGPIAGVNPWHLMLMKPLPSGKLHTRWFQAAKQAILRARKS